MDSTITSGIINYPILYFNHYHQQEIVDQIVKATQDLFPELKGIESFDQETREAKAKVKIIDFNDVQTNREALWATSPDPDEKKPKDLEWMYKNELRAIVQRMDLDKNSIDADPCVYIFRSVSYKLLTKNAEFIDYLHKFVSLHERWQKRTKGLNWTIVLIVPSGELPSPSIEGIVRIVPITPPTKEAIKEIIQEEFKESADSEKEEFCKSLQGLQLFDIRQIIQSTKTVIGEKLSYRSVKWARDEKQQIIRKTGVLDVVVPNVSFEDIGGLENLKTDLRNKAIIFKHLSVLQDDSVGCQIPKGMLLMGMPGCGKTMIAKAIASEFELPLLRLDIGKLLGQYVGQSETNLRRALEVADSAHPCVLWIDEIEKAFAGTNNTSGENNDLMMRLMGTFLTWMQERENPVYIVATANDVMKPEMMRKGRFDEVYFVDFPSQKERAAIAEAISRGYQKSNASMIKFVFNKEKWGVLAERMSIATNKKSDQNDIGLSGAEIRSLIESVVETKCIERINSLNKDKPLDLGAFEEKGDIKITLDDFIQERKDKEGNIIPSPLEEFKQSAMIHQSLWLFRNPEKDAIRDQPNDVEKFDNFIDRIYSVQKKYQFKSASNN